MTKREFLMAVIATETIADELREYAEQEITKMDERNAHRKSADRKLSEKELAKQKEDAELTEKMIEYLGECDEPQTATAIADVLGVKFQKISSLARKAGIESVEVKGKSGRKTNGYFVEK